MRVVVGNFTKEKLLRLSRRNPGTLYLSTRRRECARRGEIEAFTPETFKLALIFAAGASVLVERDAFKDALWGDREDGGGQDKAIDVFLSKYIRPQFANLGVFIETVWGRGFRVWGDVAPGDERVKPARMAIAAVPDAPREQFFVGVR